MLIKTCFSIYGNCPCIHCVSRCEGCLSERKPKEYAADTDLLCERAKAYCEKLNGGDGK
jgi:hypothetical protein